MSGSDGAAAGRLEEQNAFVTYIPQIKSGNKRKEPDSANELVYKSVTGKRQKNKDNTSPPGQSAVTSPDASAQRSTTFGINKDIGDIVPANLEGKFDAAAGEVHVRKPEVLSALEQLEEISKGNRGFVDGFRLVKHTLDFLKAMFLIKELVGHK